MQKKLKFIYSEMVVKYRVTKDETIITTLNGCYVELQRMRL